MLNSISSSMQPASAYQAQSTTPAKSAQAPKSQSTSRGTDTVTISSAATNKAVKEATETRVQTQQEAQRGDLQAQRLLAREEAAAKR